MGNEKQLYTLFFFDVSAPSFMGIVPIKDREKNAVCAQTVTINFIAQRKRHLGINLIYHKTSSTSGVAP